MCLFNSLTFHILLCWVDLDMPTRVRWTDYGDDLACHVPDFVFHSWPLKCEMRSKFRFHLRPHMDSRIWIILTMHHFPRSSLVISSTRQRVPSHPEFELEWLQSSGVGSSVDTKILPGCACGAMLVDIGWKQKQMSYRLQKLSTLE